MNQAYPSETTKKHVLAASGNQCAHPQCLELIFDLEHKTMLGEIAHIKGRRPGSARYDSTQTDGQRNSFSNLLTLCSKHHKIVDDRTNEYRYPVSLLLHWKQEHEQKIVNEQDRNWIGPHNSIMRVDGNGDALTLQYWIDRFGRPQVSTKEQIAVSQAVRKFFWLTNDIYTLIDTIKSMPKDSQNSWIVDRVNKLRLNEYGFVGTMHELFQIAHDVTFFDFTVTTTENGLALRDQLASEAVDALRRKVDDLPNNPDLSIGR